MRVASTECWLDALPSKRVRTPSILQMEAAECGATSLAIVLAYYGRIVPLAQLRRECGVSRDGSKASHILTAAKAHGLRVNAFRKELSSLKDVRCPYILFWNFNHFLVVEGYGKGHIYLNDPNSGRRKATAREFEDAFTGIVLSMEPGPEFERAGRRGGAIYGLSQRLRGSVGALLMCVCAAMLLAVPGIVYPALLETFIDKVLVRGF